MKRIISALILMTLLCGCTQNTTESTQSSEPEEIIGSMSQNDTTQDSQTSTESVSDDPVEVGDGIYRVSSFPAVENVKLSCEYGRAYRSEGATVQAFGQTLDFSSIPDEYNNDEFVYCVCNNEATVYFADYINFYKSDLELKTPTLLFTMWDEQNTLPDLMTELISFSNTDLLFFRGYIEEGSCVGSFNPETCETNFTSCEYSFVSVPCNNGVMLYDENANSDGRNSTVLYWECGDFYEIPLQNPKESEVCVYISANGKYICTYLWGKAQDRSLIERYSVYDVKSGAFLKSFDWTFKRKVGENLPKGFNLYDINEETQSIYVINSEDDELYQFYFGG